MIDVLATVSKAVHQIGTRAGQGGIDERVRRGGNQRVKRCRRLERQGRNVDRIDAAPIWVEGVVGQMFGGDYRCIVCGPETGQHLRPTRGLPAIPEARVRQRRGHSPPFAQIDRQLGRSERRDEAGKPLS
jgi:hypothetical protein